MGHRAARHLFGRAGVDVTPVDAAPGSEPVRELAESGEPIVVTAAPKASRSPGASRPSTYDDNRSSGQHRHRRNGRRPSGRRAA